MKKSRLLALLAVFAITFGLNAQTVIDDFETDLTYWTGSGDAFEIISCNSVVSGFEGNSAVTSLAGHCPAGYGGAAQEDLTGSLISPEIDLATNRLRFLIGGGDRPNEVGIKLTVGGNVVYTATGHNGGVLREEIWDITAYKGQKGIIEIFDIATGGWGHIHIDQIELLETTETVPDAPTNISAISGDTKATVIFSAPASDGGSPITSYTATSSPGDFMVSSATSPITVSELTNGTEYTFTVTATNAIGTSVASEPSNSVVPKQLIWDERPTVIFNTDYQQDFAGGEWDQTTFDNQWKQIDGMDETAIASGYLNLKWVERRVIVSNEKIDAPYAVESEVQPIPADVTYCATPIVVRANVDDSFENPQEPAQGGVVNRTGIAFIPKEGDYKNTMVVQFTNADYTSQARIEVPKPATLDSLTQKYTLRIEDYETSVYVFINNDPFVRIDLGEKIGEIYTSGVVYDADMNVMGAFTDMKVDALGKVAFATRVSQLNIYSLKIDNGSVLPDAPTDVSAVAGNTEATVSFTAPASDGGSAITSYTITSSPEGIVASGNASPIVVTGLTNGVEYTFTVIATNAVGNSEVSEASNPVTPENILTVPNPPTAVSAMAGNAEATISFTAPDNDGGSAITSYTVTSTPDAITATGTESPITITGLTNGVEYTFSVTAINAVGESAASAASEAVKPITVPDAPTNITAEIYLDNMVKVSFTTPISDGGSAITGYTVTSSPGGITQTNAISPIVVTGLTKGVAYTFTVFATNEVGESEVSEISNEITIPEEVVAIEDITQAGIKLYQRHSDIIVNLDQLNGRSSIHLIDITGKTIVSKVISGGDEFILASQLRNGLYIVRIQNEGNIYQRKIVVQ